MTQHTLDNDIIISREEMVEDSNTSANTYFGEILDKRLERRSVLKGGLGMTAAAFFGSLPLVGCGSDSGGTSTSTADNNAAVPATGDLSIPQSLKFEAVPHSTANEMSVAQGYTAEMILPLGMPLVSSISEWRDDRQNTPESFALRMGDNHDGMWFFGKSGNAYNPKSSDNGLMVMNHEYTEPELNPVPVAGSDFAVLYDSNNNPIFHAANLKKVDNAPPTYQYQRLADDVRREANAHGVSIVEMRRRSSGVGYEPVIDSAFNRRITSSTEAQFAGVAAGSDWLKTKYDPTGNKTRGINNECGAGLSPWGTYLTTEENFLNVFARGDDKVAVDSKTAKGFTRYGLPNGGVGGGYLWHTPDDKPVAMADEFDRWNAAATGATATDDYRNAYNGFGYIVEIDPFHPTTSPIKRTTLGRFAHENCAYAPVVEGKPVVCYMGDDARGEYVYKFVSKALWSNSDIGGGLTAGDKYLNEGTLYVAIFNADGTGEWKELTYGKNGIDNSYTDFPFANQAEVVIFARIAADVVGATKMDRPEWVSVSPVTGEVYVTLTNNSRRTVADVNAANPRSYNARGNDNGHIVRWREDGDNHTSTSFTWDIYVFAAPHDLAGENLSGLTANNDLSSPDGLYFDPRGVMWIQTDDGAYTSATNCMLLAALPGKVGDGTTVTTTANQATLVGKAASEDTLKRFFVGPSGCEVTGITMTADCKTLFVNIQHPGGNWAAIETNGAKGNTPRSATVMITKDDGGVILAESL
ncbi:MAG: PhoX family phosphatase [Moraxella sp.]|nr:PhoX family phosphatase [Moraxella sp.]